MEASEYETGYFHMASTRDFCWPFFPRVRKRRTDEIKYKGYDLREDTEVDGRVVWWQETKSCF